MPNEPSIQEIVEKLEGPWGCDIVRWNHDLGALQADVLALVADWRKRGEALKPFVELADDRDGKYRKHGGNPDAFPDENAAYVIKADELRLGVWRAARGALAPKP